MLFFLATMLLSGFTAGAGSSSPLTTKGDVYTFDTANQRLPVGANGLCLQTDSAQTTGIKWGSCGGGTPFHTVAVTVDFGSGGNTTATTTVTGQAWVLTTSIISCAATLVAVGTRAEGAEDAVLEGLVAAVHTRVNATGFKLTVSPRQGTARGQFLFHCVGG